MAHTNNFNQPVNNYSFSTAVARFTRLAMLLIALPLCFNLSLSSCASVDTIAPESETNASAREAATILNSETFENNKLSSFWGKELKTATSGYIAQDQQRVGKQAMRFSWKPTQYDGTNSSCHAELVTAALPKEENERWYGYSMYLPSATMANDDQVANIMQWHDMPNPGSEGTVPPIAVELQAGNKLAFIYRASEKPIVKAMQHPTSQKIINLGTAQFDTWVDYVVHVKWDASGKTGLLQVWQNGVQVINEQNISLGYVNTRPYWKMGLYCWTGKSSHAERTMYYDEIRIGNAFSSYNDVKPGRSNNTAR